MNNIDWHRCRARIEHEDRLLNSRTSLFLVVNSIGGVAARIMPSYASSLLIICVMLVANVLWLFVGLQTSRAISSLTSLYIHEASDPIDDVVRSSLDWWPRKLRSTKILGIYIPITLTLGWLAGLIMLIVAGADSLS